RQDEVGGLRDPGDPRARHRARARRGVRADHAQPDLGLPRDRARGIHHPHRLDGGRGHGLHHFRRRGLARQHPVLGAGRGAARNPGPGRVSATPGKGPLGDRATRLFITLAAFFCVNAVLAEFIGVKIFALEDTRGMRPWEWDLFGQTGSLNFTVGTLLWPIVFIMTDTVNEYFGKRGVRLVSWLSAGLIVYGFVFAFVAIHLAPASWWVTVMQDEGVPDYQAAFAAVFGQGLWTICGSLVAFIAGQLIDVHVFHRIRRRTGERHAWLRATGSTAVSQL